MRRDPQTGEQLLAGLCQIHVEVAVDRLKSRFGVEVELHQPRVPYLETIRKESRAQGRYKKQTGGRGQFGDCADRARAARRPRGLRVRRQDRRRRDPAELPARRSTRASRRRWLHGELAGAPVQGVRVSLVDGSYHNVDSSEMAFKIAGSMAFK